MELIKDFLIIIGIFVCMSLGIFFLLHSGDAKKKTKQTVQDTRDSIQETNQQLDDVLEQLQEMNAPLEKAMKHRRFSFQIGKIHHCQLGFTVAAYLEYLFFFFHLSLLVCIRKDTD